MGFLDGLLGIAGAAGLYYVYKSKYEEYGDEELLDEYAMLWKWKYQGISDDEYDMKFEIVKLVMQQRELFF